MRVNGNGCFVCVCAVHGVAGGIVNSAILTVTAKKETKTEVKI